MKTKSKKTSPAAGQREFMVRRILKGDATLKVAKAALKRRGDNFPLAKLVMLAAGYKSDVLFFRRMFTAAAAK